MATDPRTEARELMERALQLLDVAGDHAAAAMLASAIELIDHAEQDATRRGRMN